MVIKGHKTLSFTIFSLFYIFMSDCFYMNMSVYVRNGQSKTLIIRERMYLVIRVHCVSARMNGITAFSHISDSLLERQVYEQMGCCRSVRQPFMTKVLQNPNSTE